MLTEVFALFFILCAVLIIVCWDENIETKPLEADATMIPTTISPIGLLNSYEYYQTKWKRSRI